MINYLTAPFRWFFKLEAASGLLLLISAVIALIWSNSNFGNYYFDLFNTYLFIGYENLRVDARDRIITEVIDSLKMEQKLSQQQD